MSNVTNGVLAAESGYFCPLEVLESASGFYIGTFIDDSESCLFGPLSRESEEYYKTKEEAHNALLTNSWTQRTEL